MEPLVLDASIDAGKFSLRAKGFDPGGMSECFLARWLINGKAVTITSPRKTADRLEALVESDRAIRDCEGCTIEAALVIPTQLAKQLKVGDELGLDVLFNPGGCSRECLADSDHPMHERPGRGDEVQPVLAKRVSIRVTQAMLDNAASNKPAMKSQE
jgi:hypothetical protein